MLVWYMLEERGESLTKVVHFDLPDAEVVKRIAGRRVHPGSGRSYHVRFNPPKVEGVDDITGEPLIQRKDDNEETIKTRLATYKSMTAPLLDFYRNKGLLATVDAGQGISQV